MIFITQSRNYEIQYRLVLELGYAVGDVSTPQQDLFALADLQIKIELFSKKTTFNSMLKIFFL